MPSTGRVAAGIAGVTGTGSLGVTTAALIRTASAHAVPTGIWIVLAALSAATVLVAGLGLVLNYGRSQLEIMVRPEDARAQAEQKKTRLEMYQTLAERPLPAGVLGRRRWVRGEPDAVMTRCGSPAAVSAAPGGAPVRR